MNRLAAMVIAQTMSPFLTGVIVTLVLLWLLKSARAETTADEGLRVVAYPRAFKVLVVLGWVVTAAMVVFVGVVAKDADFLPLLAMFGLFATLILPLHLEVFGVLITWDETFIYTRSPWRKSRKIPLTAVRSCDYSASMMWYSVRTDGHGTIRLSQFAKGIPGLLAVLPCTHPGYPPGRPQA
jgi:uncharacterized Tic20 family protein